MEAEEQELTHCQPAPGPKFHQTLSKTGQVVQEIKKELGKDLEVFFIAIIYNFLQVPKSKLRTTSVPYPTAHCDFTTATLAPMLAVLHALTPVLLPCQCT